MDFKVLISIIVALCGIANVWLLFFVNKYSANRVSQEERLQKLENKQTEHEAKFTTDSQVRNIIREEISSIKEDVQDIKGNVDSMMAEVNNLVTELRIINAINEYKSSNDKQD